MSNELIEESILVPVTATHKYLREQSDPINQKFVWSYEITISNHTDKILQLLARNWRITDMTGKIDEIRGPGVVGLQPIIKPGKSFIYTSFCQLITPQGIMEGYYELQDLNDNLFNVEIPKFILTGPDVWTKPFREKLH